MARIRFPEDFHWGAATSAHQIEGASRADGKGESIWDRFSQRPGRVAGGATADVACDSYLRYREDIALLRELHCTSYRFSIAWPRIQPAGRGKALAAGLDHYRALVDALLESGIRPLPTLYHWDLPQALEERGGWASRDTAGRFADYAEQLAQGLGDRIETWVLLNEPGIFTALGYWIGIHAPGRRDPDAFLRATHVANLAQAEAARAIRAHRGDARLGSALSLSPCEPAGDAEADAEAAHRLDAFTNRWFLEPALTGAYPAAFPGGNPLERMGVRHGDAQRLRADLDFVGVNHYQRTRVRAEADDPFGLGARPVGFGGPDGPRTDFGWEVWPPALYDTLMTLHRAHPELAIEITENGASYGEVPGPDGRVRDERRIAFHRGQLESVARAIDAGAPVRSYHAWSLLDDFEWAEGYGQRFGLVHVDFDSADRTIKDSGRWYANVAADNGFDT